MTTYTIRPGDVLLCDIDTWMSAAAPPTAQVLTIPTWNSATGGLVFNFNKGASVQKQLDKTVYIIKKPGVPMGYEIGLTERIFNITATIKKPEANYTGSVVGGIQPYTFQSLADLNNLADAQHFRMRTLSDTGTAVSKKSKGILNFYYYGDKFQYWFYKVMVKSVWYEQPEGAGSLFNVRISLSEVVAP